jgi:protein-disulfide isomerase
MSKRFLIIITVLIVLFGGFLWFSKAKDNKQKANIGGGQPTNHVQGQGTKKVTIVEYGDFQCPACGAYYPIVEQARAKYGDDITFQFRHFPLVQIHQNAMAAHRAAEAADKQGKFWEMYNLLYTNQQSWSSGTNVNAIFEAYAQQLGLDMDKFRKDVASNEVGNAINADIKAGQSLGVNSTPTFFINGKKVDPLPNRTLEAFSKLIDDVINSQNPQN